MSASASSDHARVDAPETLEAFKNSFYYGSRSNLDFKFLSDLSTDDAGRFFDELLRLLGRTMNDGDAHRLVDHVVNSQQRAYTSHLDDRAAFAYDDGPFSPPRKKVSESRVALITSSGHFVEGDDPEPFGVTDMTQEEAEARVGEFLRAAPTLSTIPTDTDVGELRVRHGGYPVHAAETDHNVVLPLTALHGLVADGTVGQFAEHAYSFVGATSQLRLRDHVVAEWVERLRDDEIDVVLLVPV